MEKINIKTTNIDLSDAIRSYIEKKFEGIEKVLNADEVKGQVEVGKISNHHKSGDVFKAEINLETNGAFFRATAEEVDLYMAIDVVKNEIVSEVKKAKTKNQSRVRKGGQKVKSLLKGLRRKSS